MNYIASYQSKFQNINYLAIVPYLVSLCQFVYSYILPTYVPVELHTSVFSKS